MKKLKNQRTQIAAALTTLLGSGLVCAQSVPATSNSASRQQLDEVVVTAQRRSEDLQKTPIAVTALSANTLQERSVNSSLDLMQIVPSLQVSTQVSGDGNNSATFSIRGFGQQTQLNGSQPAVGVYIDDFYYPSLEGSVFSILDFSQVEVLRGPQGTLFGRNTIGGAIRYTSKKPDQDLGGYISATLGNYGRKDVSGAVNLPFGPTTALRLTVGRLSSDGFVKKATGGYAGGGTSDVARAQLRIEPTQSVTIDLQAQYVHTFADGFAYSLPGPGQLPDAGGTRFNGALLFPFNNFTPIGRATPYDARYASQCGYCQPGATDKSSNNSTGGNAVVAWDINDHLTFKSLTGYTQVQSAAIVDLDGTILPLVDVRSGFATRATSQEFQLNGHSGSLNWVTGLFLYDSAFSASGIDGIQVTVLGNPIPDAKTSRYTKNAAGYVDLTWALTNQLSLLGGFRYSKERLHITSIPSTTLILTQAYASYASDTGRLGVQYQWNPDAMTYATVSQGFRAGGFNRLNSGVLEAFSPEKDTTYELGGRFTLLDRTLRFNPTVFYNKWTNIQVQRIESAAGQQLVHFENAARAHSYGLELEVDAALSKPLHVFGHLATLKAKYDDIGAATSIAIDSQFQHAPKVSGGVGASYAMQLTSGSLTGNVDYSWQDKQYSTPTNGAAGPDALILPSYQLTNLRLEYKNRDGKWSIAASVTNLFNKTYYIGGVSYDQDTSHFDLGRPREYGLNLRYNF